MKKRGACRIGWSVAFILLLALTGASCAYLPKHRLLIDEHAFFDNIRKLVVEKTPELAPEEVYVIQHLEPEARYYVPMQQFNYGWHLNRSRKLVVNGCYLVENGKDVYFAVFIYLFDGSKLLVEQSKYAQKELYFNYPGKR